MLTIRDTAGGFNYDVTDLLGTPIANLNLASGILGETLDAPYGQNRYTANASGPGGMQTAKGFTGQYQDISMAGSSQLDYFNARYYDPVIGRFTSADDAQPGLGDPLGLDGYGYVGGQVETAIDPSGHSCGGVDDSILGVVACAVGDPPVAPITWEQFQSIWNGNSSDTQNEGDTGSTNSTTAPPATDWRAGAGTALAIAGALGGIGAAADPLIGRSRNGDTTLSGEIHSAPRLSSQGGTKSQPSVQQLSLFGDEPQAEPEPLPVPAGAGAGQRGGGPICSNYWTPSEFGGQTVYQRDDLIDPNLVGADGRTNLQRMLQGNPPIGPDGEPMQLHHMLQTMDGPLAEVTRTFHQTNKKVIDVNPDTIPSGIDRSAFGQQREAYWQARGMGYLGFSQPCLFS